MIKRILLDMDGTLCNFVAAAKALHAYDDETDKADWDIIRAQGPDFWAKLKWLPGSQQFYKDLAAFCKRKGIALGVLSAIHYEDGVIGKRDWILNHCPQVKPENVIIVPHRTKKVDYANENTILVDDKESNCREFYDAGGFGILYSIPEPTLCIIKERVKYPVRNED